MQRINKQEVYRFLNRKNKWLGIIDYRTLFVFTIYSLIILKATFSLGIDILYKLYISIILILPFIIFIIVNINEEDILNKLRIIIMYYLNNKIFVKGEYKAKLDTTYIKNVDNVDIVKSKIK